MIKSNYLPTNLPGDQDGWLTESRTFDPTGSTTIDLIVPGAIVKLVPATGAIQAYLAADLAAAAVPYGIVIRKSDTTETNLSISIKGVFDENQITFWDPAAVPPAFSTAAPTAALEALLKTANIYLRPAVPSGAFAP